MKKLFTIILLHLVSVTLFAQFTNTRQIRFKPITNASDTSATAGHDGRMWYDANNGVLRLNVAGTNTTVGSGGGGGGSYTFGNGLTESGGTVSLGGALTGNTSITGGFANSLEYTNLSTYTTYAIGGVTFQAGSGSNFFLAQDDFELNTFSGAISVGGELVSATPTLLLTAPQFSFNINSSTGTSGQVLTSDGTNASWQDASGGIGGSTGSVDNRLLRADGTGGSTLQASSLLLSDDSGEVILSKNGVTNFRIIGPTGTNQNVGDLILQGGTYSVSGGTVGDTYIRGGENDSGTLEGNVGFHMDTPTANAFGSGVGIEQVADALVNPTTVPSGSYLRWSQGGDPMFQTSSSEVINLAAVAIPTSDTGTAIEFDTPRFYGDTTPETGNITLNSTGLIKGVTQLVIHNNSSTPTFGAEFKIISGAYVINEDNYIYMQAISSSLILVTISQEL